MKPLAITHRASCYHEPLYPCARHQRVWLWHEAHHKTSIIVTSSMGNRFVQHLLISQLIWQVAWHIFGPSEQMW